MKTYRLKHNKELSIKVYLADNFFTRLRGLIGKNLEDDEGLLLSPCNQIHCIMMSFPIDVIYLSKDWHVIKIDRGMRSGSIGKRVKDCKYILEVISGNSKKYGYEIGDLLELSK